MRLQTFQKCKIRPAQFTRVSGSKFFYNSIFTHLSFAQRAGSLAFVWLMIIAMIAVHTPEIMAKKSSLLDYGHAMPTVKKQTDNFFFGFRVKNARAFSLLTIVYIQHAILKKFVLSKFLNFFNSARAFCYIAVRMQILSFSG